MNNICNPLILIGTPGAIRTHDTRIRNPVLYPTELRGLRMNLVKRDRPLT